MTSLALGTGLLDMNYKSSGNNYNTYRVQVLSDSTVVVFLNNGAQALGSRTYTEVMRISPSGLISFNGVTPIARLSLPQGSTTVAPLRIPGGTLMTTPGIGSVEADGNFLYYTDGNTVTRRAIMSIVPSSWTTNNIPYFSSSTLLSSSANLTFDGITLRVSTGLTTTTPLLSLLAAGMTTNNETRCVVGRTNTNSTYVFFDGSVAGIKNGNASTYYIGLDSSGNVVANTTIKSASITPYFATSVTANNQWVAIGNLSFGTNQTANIEVQTRIGRTFIEIQEGPTWTGTYWSVQNTEITGVGIIGGTVYIRLASQTWLDVYVKTSGVWTPASSYVTSTPGAMTSLTPTFTVGLGSSTGVIRPLSIVTTDTTFPTQITGGLQISGQIRISNADSMPLANADGNGGQGCRLVLRNAANAVPYAIGSNTSEMFLSVHDNTHSHVLYTGLTKTTSFSNGTMVTTGDVTAFGAVSDRRLKENVEPLEAIDIKTLRPVKFTWKNDIFNESKRGQHDVGFIAQEVEEIIPEVVTGFKLDELNYRAIKYEKLVPYLVKTIQDLTLRVEHLESMLQHQV